VQVLLVFKEKFLRIKVRRLCESTTELRHIPEKVIRRKKTPRNTSERFEKVN